MQTDHESLIPEKFKVLSGSWLKLIAVVTMVIDHVAFVLLKDSTIILLQVGEKSLKLYTLMRLIGRLAFPIYAFLLVEGFLYTKDRRKYGWRLFLFALISEIPWNLEHAGTWRYSSQNVFFTLFLGFLGLCVIESFMKAEGRKRIVFAGFLAGLLIVSVILKADYGCSGFGFILMMYLMRSAPVYRAVIGSCFLSSRWKAGLAFIPIALYNGKRGFIKGRFTKVLFYAIYPAHILLLYWIRAHTIGY